MVTEHNFFVNPYCSCVQSETPHPDIDITIQSIASSTCKTARNIQCDYRNSGILEQVCHCIARSHAYLDLRDREARARARYGCGRVAHVLRDARSACEQRFPYIYGFLTD